MVLLVLSTGAHSPRTLSRQGLQPAHRLANERRAARESVDRLLQLLALHRIASHHIAFNTQLADVLPMYACERRCHRRRMLCSGMLLRALGSARHSSGNCVAVRCVGSACLRLRQRVALKAQLQLVVPECRRHPLHTNKRTLTLPFGVRKCVPGTASCAHSRPYTHGWSERVWANAPSPACLAPS